LDDDLDVQMLDPSKDCLDSLGVDRVKDYEVAYWDKVTLQYLNLRDHSNDLKISVTFLGLSPFLEYLVVGMSNGEVQLYDTVSSPGSISLFVTN
jgi:WD40 repeat protein